MSLWITIPCATLLGIFSVAWLGMMGYAIYDLLRYSSETDRIGS